MDEMACICQSPDECLGIPGALDEDPTKVCQACLKMPIDEACLKDWPIE